MTPRFMTVKGAFETVHGPWTPGVNMLVLNAFELDPFKGALAGFVRVTTAGGSDDFDVHYTAH